MSRVRVNVAMFLVLASAGPLALAQSDTASTVYKCPGKPVLYTSSNSISAKEAKERGCTTIEGAPITVIAGPKPRPATSSSGSSGTSSSAPRATEGGRVEPGEQRVRDNDARRILESELRKEEESLAAMKKEYNNGEPERRGDERNYQKYIDRVAELKASVARKESDVTALKRELGKLQ